VLQICDFGLAKWKQQAATQTTTGKRRGTIAYMAPEVFRDVNTPRTVKYDVYSFGILLWELFSEKKPFEYGIDINCLFSSSVHIYYIWCIKVTYYFHLFYLPMVTVDIKLGCLFVHPSVCPSGRLYICPSVRPSVCLSVCLFGTYPSDSAERIWLKLCTRWRSVPDTVSHILVAISPGILMGDPNHQNMYRGGDSVSVLHWAIYLLLHLFYNVCLMCLCW